jgi:hypothetical protein
MLENSMKSVSHIANKAKGKDRSDRFLIVGILLALGVCVTGILLTNLHFNRKNRAFLNTLISDKLQTAREAVDRKKWDEAIELLTATKASTNPHELDDAGRETLAKLERLLNEAKNSKSKQQVEVAMTKAKVEAELMFKSAEEAIRNGRWALADGRLLRYLRSPAVSHKERATLLLYAIEASNSDRGAVDFLTLLSDSEFSNFEKTGSLIGIDSLRKKCLERLRRNVPHAKIKREILSKFDEEAARYERDVSRIKKAVLARTIWPESAVFCERFSVLRNRRGNKVYLGWYRSKGFLNGVEGEDKLIAEVDDDGDILKLDIGAVE